MAVQPQNQPELSDNDSIESETTYQEQDSNPPDIYNALQYVQSVQNTFGENTEEYLHFLALLNDFKHQRISIPVVVSRLKILFFEHQELTEGFNQFLPEGYQIALPLTRRSETSLQETIYYNNKVKAALSQEKERYLSFVQLNVDYQDAKISLLHLIEQMCQLLSERQELLKEFFNYIPSRRQTF